MPPPVGPLLAAALLGQFVEPPVVPVPEALAKVVPGVTLEDSPVRRALTNVAAANGLSVVLDRDVDPTVPVSLQAAGGTVAEVLTEVSRQADAAAAPVGGAVFVGPPEKVAAVLAAVDASRAELRPGRGVSKTVRERLLAPRSIEWDDYATPREVVAAIGERWGVSVENPEAVPHDVWAGGRLPAADAAAAFSAVLGQFGMTFAWVDDARAVRIESLPTDFAPPPAPPLTASAVKTAVGEGGGVPLERRTFTLTVAAPVTVRQVMETVAASGVRFEFDPRALAAGGGNLDAAAAVDVRGADAEEFLAALFAPANVTATFEGTTVTLAPR